MWRKINHKCYLKKEDLLEKAHIWQLCLKSVVFVLRNDRTSAQSQGPSKMQLYA